MSTFKTNLSILLSTTIIIKILGFLHKIISARFLSFEVLEALSLLSPIINLALVISSASLPSLINKEVSINLTKKNYSNRKIISSSIKITMILSFSISLIFLFLSYTIATSLYQNNNLVLPIIITIPLIIFSNLSGIMKAYLEAHDNFRYPVLSNLLEQILKSTILIITIFLFKDKSVLVITVILSSSLILAEILSFSYLFFKIKKMTPIKLTKTNLNFDKKLLKPSLFLTLFSLIFTLSAFLEPLIYYQFTARVLIDPKTTRLIYTSLHNLIIPFMQMASFLTYVLVKIFYPKFAKETNEKSISSNLKMAYYILLPLNVVLLALSVALPKEVLTFFFKKSAGYQLLYIIAPFTFITFLSPLQTALLQSKGYERKLLKNSLISSIISITVLMVLALIQSLSAISLIIALITKELFYFFTNSVYIKNFFHIKIKILPLIMLIFIILIIFFINQLTLDLNLYFRFLILVFTSLTLTILLVFSRFINKFD